jgi:hypothetical protein
VKLIQRQTFTCSINQKETLLLLRKKYNINTSQFIRDAIDEKLHRDKNIIFANYKKIHSYLKKDCPF